MNWDWQNVATLAIVASAAGYLVLKFVPGLTRKPATACAHCPVKKPGGAGACHEAPVVITLSVPPPARNRPSP